MFVSSNGLLGLWGVSSGPPGASSMAYVSHTFLYTIQLNYLISFFVCFFCQPRLCQGRQCQASRVVPVPCPEALEPFCLDSGHCLLENSAVSRARHQDSNQIWMVRGFRHSLFSLLPRPPDLFSNIAEANHKLNRTPMCFPRPLS